MNPIDTKLYELFSDKTLSEGCKVFIPQPKDDKEVPNRLLTCHCSIFQRNYGVQGGYNTKTESIYHFYNYDETHEYSIRELEKQGKYEILGHEPQLHDVFRMIDEKFRHGWEMISKVKSQSESPYNQDRIILHLMSSSTVKMDNSHFSYIPYNPTLSLIAQSDETKQAIIDLLSN